MASHESALKAHRQSLKNRERNRQYRSRLRNALRDIRSAVERVFETDLALKRSAGDPRILLERLVVELCSRGIRRETRVGS